MQVLDLNDAVAHLVEEVAVVADDQLCTVEVPKEVFQPFRGLNVEVVGRLVKEDDVHAGQAHQLSCKGQLGLLTAGEGGHLHVHGVLVQPEARQDGFRDARHVPAPRLREGLLKFRVTLHDRFPVGFVEGGVHHLCFDGGDLLLQFLELASLSRQLFLNGPVAFEVPDLGQVSDTQPWCEIDVADVLFLVGNGVE